MRVLIIEDDAGVTEVLERGLSEHGMETRHAGDAAAGYEMASDGLYDVVVLDVMLPRGSGIDVCRMLRANGVTVPILMLTARDAIDDRVRGLDAGADDYLTKPFAFRELLARVRALARRRPALQSQIVEVADLRVDLTTHEVRRGDTRVVLTAREFALLECLVLNLGRIVDRGTITAHVWDDNHDPFTNVLEVLVRRLRRKIDDNFTPRLIQTVRGAGYRLAR
jgi:two-component system copper resistance phosphate regulon response regulator CusR